jgi:hypothetical protein
MCLFAWRLQPGNYNPSTASDHQPATRASLHSGGGNGNRRGSNVNYLAISHTRKYS